MHHFYVQITVIKLITIVKIVHALKYFTFIATFGRKHGCRVLFYQPFVVLSICLFVNRISQKDMGGLSFL